MKRVEFETQYLPLKGGGIGGLRPPYLITPMRSIGYGAQRAGWGSSSRMTTPPRTAFGGPTLPFQGREKEWK